MIFVTVGTNEARFDRLLRCVENLEADDIVVQYGCSTYRPRNAECFAFFTFEELVGYMRAASVVVTHAGVGSVSVALANGRCPVVVPRLRRYGEAIDDHQLALGRRLAQSGLVTLVEEPEILGEQHIKSAASSPEWQPGAALVTDLSDCVHQFVEARKGFSRQQNPVTVGERAGGGGGD
jgi:UDP-N-acetylglucosamine transferase subunit ALG13